MNAMPRSNRAYYLKFVYLLTALQLVVLPVSAQAFAAGVTDPRNSALHHIDGQWKRPPLALFMLNSPTSSTSSALRSPWDYGTLGLFCKIDVQFARYLPIPLFMRLGDVRHEIDWEHGTGPGWKP